MGAQLTSLTKGMSDTWARLGKVQKAIIAGAIAVVFVLSSVMLALGNKGANYETLFSGLDPTDAGAIVSELEREGIPYELADGGGTIKVPAENLHRTRLSLASQGLPSSGIVGFESISGNSIWATDFERRVQYIRALSGELTRTVESISGVEDARVHIVLPEDTVFAAEKTPATAAVLLKLRPMQELSASAVKGIMNLVARSVEGLSPNEVTVMDTTGRLLSSDYAASDILGGAGTAAYELTSKVERDLERRLISMLSPVLGPGNVVCQVRANLNLDQTRTTEDAFITDPENPQGVLRSTQQITETYSGTGVPAGGTAGGLDVPTYATGGTGQSNYQRVETIQNYEVTHRTTETLVNPGTVKNLSVAVMVNKELDEEQTAVIRESVSAALGLDPLRQDRISVTGLKFDTSLVDELQAGMTPAPQPLNRVYIYGAAVLAALVVGTVIIFMLRRRKAAQAPVELVEEETPAEPDLLSEPTMTPAALSKQRMRETVERMARTNPETVATLVKTWLLEDER
ncbi:MAG: flagellar basal-body MS-ring/collar protein FliF [Bacillota bacterium]